MYTSPSRVLPILNRPPTYVTFCVANLSSPLPPLATRPNAENTAGGGLGEGPDAKRVLVQPERDEGQPLLSLPYAFPPRLPLTLPPPPTIFAERGATCCRSETPRSPWPRLFFARGACAHPRKKYVKDGDELASRHSHAEMPCPLLAPLALGEERRRTSQRKGTGGSLARGAISVMGGVRRWKTSLPET